MEKYLKNILVVSFGFLLLFTAYGGLQSLQSSLHSQEGLGVASLSVVYAALIMSSMFLPPILIKKLGCKWTIVGSMCCYITFSLGNFYASWYTLIPTSVILGLGGAPLWSAKCTYLTIAGNLYAQKKGKNGKDVINQYFGIFFLIFQSSGVWGNLISSLVFGQTPEKATISEAQLACCGAYDCTVANGTKNPGTPKGPSNTLIYILLGIYTASGVLAVLLVVFLLDKIETNQEEGKEEKKHSFWFTFLATFRHLKDKRQCLLIPLTMYSGFEQGFLAGDYTKSYVTCALGINFVGYVMICFSGANSLCSMLFGKISQFTGRRALFALVAIVHIACIITMLLWKPHPKHLALFFVLSALWGVGDAALQTQTNALYGVLFEKHKEAGFANYRLWESLGFVIAFGYSTFLQVYIKLYIVLAVLIIAMAAYGTVEYLESKTSREIPNATKEEPIKTQQNAQQTKL
ncbi:protein unc-93 homolog A [Tiliqua scincoides]|uniref:protein unc-93 homolog A n=1 Tax=Tiliqua scincoides TaxID=71010 RepID=UPI003461A41A